MQRLDATDDCDFSPFVRDEKPEHGSPDCAREVAMRKISNRLQGARMASEELGVESSGPGSQTAQRTLLGGARSVATATARVTTIGFFSYWDPRSVQEWSARGLFTSLEELGVRVHPMDARPFGRSGLGLLRRIGAYRGGPTAALYSPELSGFARPPLRSSSVAPRRLTGSFR